MAQTEMNGPLGTSSQVKLTSLDLASTVTDRQTDRQKHSSRAATAMRSVLERKHVYLFIFA